METIIHQYGYAVIFVVTLFEGETVLLIAGILAHQGFLNLELSMLSAFLGSTIGDQLFFHFARQEGFGFARKFKHVASVLPRAERLVHKYGAYVVLFSRYVYGLRSALIVMCGMAKMSPSKFTGFNIASAMIWAVSYGFLGYFFSEAISSFIGLNRIELIVAAALAIAAVIYWAVRTANSKPASEQPKQEV